MLGRTSDFSPVADRYDATRHIPEAVLLEAYRRLTAAGVLPAHGRLLDLGCGTGQISCPLARMGHAVVGLDVSDAMMRAAAAKVQPAWDARYSIGDARATDQPDAAFDAVVFSKLLMHVEDWRAVCREALRVTRPGGAVLQISERGFFDTAVRRAFSRRADAIGHTDRFLGPVPSSGVARAYMADIGCDVSRLEFPDLRWEHRIRPRDVLQGFRERLFAEFWTMPIATYDAILAEVSGWAAEQPGGLDAEEVLRPSLLIEVYRRPR